MATVAGDLPAGDRPPRIESRPARLAGSGRAGGGAVLPERPHRVPEGDPRDLVHSSRRLGERGHRLVPRDLPLALSCRHRGARGAAGLGARLSQVAAVAGNADRGRRGRIRRRRLAARDLHHSRARLHGGHRLLGQDGGDAVDGRDRSPDLARSRPRHRHCRAPIRPARAGPSTRCSTSCRPSPPSLISCRSWCCSGSGRWSAFWRAPSTRYRRWCATSCSAWSGCRPRLWSRRPCRGPPIGQLLWWVKLPAAMPTILMGVNQTTMATLGMVVIAAMLGGIDDIGLEVFIMMKRAAFGESLLAGLVIALVAMILDRISRGFVDRRMDVRIAESDSPYRRQLLLGALASVVLGKRSRAVSARHQGLPESLGLVPGRAPEQRPQLVHQRVLRSHLGDQDLGDLLLSPAAQARPGEGGAPEVLGLRAHLDGQARLLALDDSRSRSSRRASPAGGSR